VLAQLQQRLGQQLPHQQLSAHPDGRGIRVGFLSRLPLETPVQLHPLAVGLSPVQVGDDDQDPATPLPTTGTMGRGALQVTVTAHGHPLTLLTAHLKSKLLTFPGDRFQPRDEAERARFGAYALYLRAAQAATLRANQLAWEVETLVGAGLEPYDALAAATVNGGRLLREPAVGVLVQGGPADFVLVHGDPLSDPRSLWRVWRTTW
jgi:hypothetical protein